MCVQITAWQIPGSECLECWLPTCSVSSCMLTVAKMGTMICIFNHHDNIEKEKNIISKMNKIPELSTRGSWAQTPYICQFLQMYVRNNVWNLLASFTVKETGTNLTLSLNYYQVVMIKKSHSSRTLVLPHLYDSRFNCLRCAWRSSYFPAVILTITYVLNALLMETQMQERANESGIV